MFKKQRNVWATVSKYKKDLSLTRLLTTWPANVLTVPQNKVKPDSKVIQRPATCIFYFYFYFYSFKEHKISVGKRDWKRGDIPSTNMTCIHTKHRLLHASICINLINDSTIQQWNAELAWKRIKNHEKHVEK